MTAAAIHARGVDGRVWAIDASQRDGLLEAHAQKTSFHALLAGDLVELVALCTENGEDLPEPPMTKTTNRRATAMPKKNGNQTQIPGTERKVHRDVREAAEAYVEVRDERMALTTRETEAKTELMTAMKKHGLTHHIDEDAELEITIVPVDETVKVKRWKPKPEAKSDDAGESAEA